MMGTNPRGITGCTSGRQLTAKIAGKVGSPEFHQENVKLWGLGLMRTVVRKISSQATFQKDLFIPLLLKPSIFRKRLASKS